MRPLIVADPMLRAPSPEIVSESSVGCWARAAAARAKPSAAVDRKEMSFLFIELFLAEVRSWLREEPMFIAVELRLVRPIGYRHYAPNGAEDDQVVMANSIG